jgi:hypothetical protein
MGEDANELAASEHGGGATEVLNALARQPHLPLQ